MYFSKICIKNEAFHSGLMRNEPMSLYNEHAFIWNLFPYDAQANRDFLYRRLEVKDGLQYYVLSTRKPIEHPIQYEIETKPYTPIINHGESLRFSLRVNPVVTKKIEGAGSKKRKREDIYMDALAKNKQLPESERLPNSVLLNSCALDWLEQRAKSNGFAASREEVIVEGYRRFEMRKKRGTDKITFGAVDFTGILTVTNKELFSRVLQQGLGKSKAFGCGLLLIRRL